MENIGIKNGVAISKTDKYCMYHTYFPNTDELFICVPNTTFDNYKIVMDFADVDFSATDINIDDKISGMFSEKAKKLYEQEPNSIYVIPKITVTEFNDAIYENDYRLYERFVKKIERCRNNAYWSIANSAIFPDTVHVDPQVSIMKQGDEDVKLYWWLDMNDIIGYKQLELIDPEKEAEKQKAYPDGTPIVNFTRDDYIPREDPTKKKKRTPGDGIHSIGFSNLGFIITILVLTGILGTCLAYLILR